MVQAQRLVDIHMRHHTLLRFPEGGRIQGVDHLREEHLMKLKAIIIAISAVLALSMAACSSEKPADKTAETTPAAEVMDTVTETAGEAADAVGEAVGDAADAVGEAASDAADAVGEAASDAMDAAEETTDEAVAAVESAIDEPADPVEPVAPVEPAVPAVGH